MNDQKDVDNELEELMGQEIMHAQMKLFKNFAKKKPKEPKDAQSYEYGLDEDKCCHHDK